MKLIPLLMITATVFLFSGCTITSAGVAQQVNKQNSKRYDRYIQSKKEIVKEVMETLAKLNRGGMKIELDENGKVKAIEYTERLDTSVLKQALNIPVPKTYIPKSGIEEVGMFVGALGSVLTPISSMWFGYKTSKSNNQAQVAITQSNNQRDTSMYNAFTSHFQNNTYSNKQTDKQIEKQTIQAEKQIDKQTIQTDKQTVQFTQMEKSTDKTFISSDSNASQ